MFLQGTVNGQSFLYSGFPNVLVNCQNRTSRYVSGNSCTPVRGLLIIIHVCTWIESRKRLSITNLWQFLSWVIKRICNLPIPNEAGRALGTVAYMYKTHIKKRGCELMIRFCTSMQSARPAWVIKWGCKLSIPNEYDMPVWSAAHIYDGNQFLSGNCIQIRS